MKNIKQIIVIVMMLLIGITSTANSPTSEKDFGVRINLISLLKIEKIKDIDFGDVYIEDDIQGLKASGEFKVIGARNEEVEFEVSEIQKLTNGSHTIPMKTYVSDRENGSEIDEADLSNIGEYHGYLVAELGDVKGAQPGEYTGRVTLTVEYD